MIQLLTASWCRPCSSMKEFITTNNLDVEIIDIESDLGSEMVDIYGVKSIPTFIIDETYATHLTTKELLELCQKK